MAAVSVPVGERGSRRGKGTEGLLERRRERVKGTGPGASSPLHAISPGRPRGNESTPCSSTCCPNKGAKSSQNRLPGLTPDDQSEGRMQSRKTQCLPGGQPDVTSATPGAPRAPPAHVGACGFPSSAPPVNAPPREGSPWKRRLSQQRHSELRGFPPSRPSQQVPKGPCRIRKLPNGFQGPENIPRGRKGPCKSMQVGDQQHFPSLGLEDKALFKPLPEPRGTWSHDVLSTGWTLRVNHAIRKREATHGAPGHKL